MQEDREQRKKEQLLKKVKLIKKIVAISGGSFPLVIVFALLFATAVAALLPIFMVTTMVGGKTVYGNSKNDVPSDLTINGIDTWSEEERKIFDDMTKEKKYFDSGFSNYNVSRIMLNENEELDISTPISTIHYQGTVNLTTFDDEYIKEIFSDGTASTDYNDETNVENKHTRDFYKKAGEKIGNTFMIYPGMRMLLGNMVKNIVNFDTVECGIRKCPAGSFSSWRLLGKITSSNESDASSSYGVGAAIDKVVTAIQDGEKGCSNESDEWKKQNMCYDTDLLFNEIFGERFSVNGRKSIIDYLEDRYSGSDSKAHVPLSSYISDGYYSPGTYISVTVKKKTDYNLYEKYLKEIYIPYVYINCDSCGYKDASDQMKSDHADSILKEILQFTNSFKKYNGDDQIGSSGLIVPGGFGHVVPASGFDYLPEEYFSQMISPLVGQNGTTTLSSCVGYYDAVENTSYYCVGHDAADIVGGGGIVVAPADGVITYCSTNYGNWGPLLGITHTLKDKNGNDTKVISWYRHWVDLNGNVDCSTLYENRVVKEGENLAKESNQAGSFSVARHLHFKLTASDGTVYYIEDFLQSKGVNTSSANGTTDCDQVRRTCNAYCKDENNECTSTY